MVSHPGVGKTQAISIVEHFLSKHSQIHILPTTVTREQLYNEMQEHSVRKINGVDIEIMCSSVALPDELGVFVKPRDFEFMQDLTKFYDCRQLFTYKTKNAGENRLENISMTILGGTQPETLRKILPPEAFGMGFAARFVLVFSNEEVRQPPFSGPPLDQVLEQGLINDLKTITQLSGEFLFHKDSEKKIEAWYAEGMIPAPSDRRLLSYSKRRLLHWLKLCIIVCASESDHTLITPSHVDLAKDIMLETETEMALSFSAMGEASSISQIENVYSFITAEHTRTKRGIEEWKVRDMLIREMPLYAIKSAMQEMENAGWIKIGPGDEGKRLIYPGRNVYTPPS